MITKVTMNYAVNDCTSDNYSIFKLLKILHFITRAYLRLKNDNVSKKNLILPNTLYKLHITTTKQHTPPTRKQKINYEKLRIFKIKKGDNTRLLYNR